MVLFSLGIGFLNFYLAAIVAVQQYFDKKRAFATGIVSSGLSLGIFVWSPVTRFLIDKYNWQGALLLEGGIFLNGIILGALLRPQGSNDSMMVQLAKIAEDESSGASSSSSSSSKCAILSKIPCKKFLGFYAFLIGYFFIQIGHMTVYGYMPVKGDSLGISKSNISILISIMGITGIFARPCIGFIGDLRWADRTTFVGLSAVIVGCCSIVSTQLTSFIPLIIYSALFGFFCCKYTPHTYYTLREESTRRMLFYSTNYRQQF